MVPNQTLNIPNACLLFALGRTPCLEDEDFYLAIGWTFYGGHQMMLF